MASSGYGSGRRSRSSGCRSRRHAAPPPHVPQYRASGVSLRRVPNGDAFLLGRRLERLPIDGTLIAARHLQDLLPLESLAINLGVPRKIRSHLGSWGVLLLELLQV